MCSPEKDCLLSFLAYSSKENYITLGEDEWLDVSNRLTILRQESLFVNPAIFVNIIITPSTIFTILVSGPCMVVPRPCFEGVTCVNTGGGQFLCLDCPPGYVGDGDDCIDIDEVFFSFEFSSLKKCTS